MMSPICVPCERFYRCEKNELLFLLHNVSIWEGDLYKCPKCNHQIIVGIAEEPLVTQFDPNFRQWCEKWDVTLNIKD